VIYREIDAGQASQVFALLNWPAFQMIWKVAGSGRQSHFGFGAAVLVRAVLVRAELRVLSPHGSTARTRATAVKQEQPVGCSCFCVLYG
jgi:hypothetical protein